MVEICVFVAGFVVGGMAGMAVMALAASVSMADRRTRETTKEVTDDDS